MTVTNNIYQKQIKYHVFNAVTNSELTEIVPVFTIWPAFPTSVKKVSTSFKNVWRTWGPALPTLLADLKIFCPLGPTNFKNSVTERVDRGYAYPFSHPSSPFSHPFSHFSHLASPFSFPSFFLPLFSFLQPLVSFLPVSLYTVRPLITDAQTGQKKTIYKQSSR